MTRKTRVDTVAGAVAVAAAIRQIEPPSDAHLVEGARAHFDRTVAARPATVWNDEALAFAVTYANHLAMVLRLQAELEKLDVLSSEAKDLRTALHGAASMAKQARQSLGLHDRGQNGEKRDSAKRDTHARLVEAGLSPDQAGLLN